MGISRSEVGQVAGRARPSFLPLPAKSPSQGIVRGGDGGVDSVDVNRSQGGCMKDTKVDVTDLTASLKELAKEFVSCKSPDNRTVEELQEQCASIIAVRSKIATRMNSV